MPRQLSPEWLVFLQTRTPESRTAVILSYDYLPEKVLCCGWGKRLKQGGQHYDSKEDLLSAAKAGLLKGVDSWDPEGKANAKTHLSNCIRNAIMQELCVLDPLKRGDRQKVRAGGEAPAASVQVPMSSMAEDSRETPAFRDQRSLSPDGVALLKEALRSALAGRPRVEVTALVLHHLERMPQRNIAAVLTRKEHSANVPHWVRKILQNPGS